MTTLLGKRLRAQRHRLGESEATTATRFDVSQASYHRWESGRHEPQLNRFPAIAGFLGVPVGDVALLALDRDPDTDAASAEDGEVDLEPRIASLERAVISIRRELRVLQIGSRAQARRGSS